MFPTVSPSSTRRALGDDDLSGLGQLYPERSWTDIGHANDLVAMAGLAGKLYCATADNRLWMREPVPWEVGWIDIGHANNVVAMDAIAGNLFCATTGNRLWIRPPGP